MIAVKIMAGALLLALALLAAYVPVVVHNGAQGSEHGSPVQLGRDVGRLEDSRHVASSVLVACKHDQMQPTVYSRGRRAVGTHIYSVADRSVGGGCERNFTGRRLWQHWLDQGPLRSTVSNHTTAQTLSEEQTVEAEGLRAHLGNSVAYRLRRRAIICDHNVNGVKEYAHFYRRGEPAVRSVQDANGADPGCSRSAREHNRITDIRVCWFNQYAVPNRCGDWASNH